MDEKYQFDSKLWQVNISGFGPAGLAMSDKSAWKIADQIIENIKTEVYPPTQCPLTPQARSGLQYVASKYGHRVLREDWIFYEGESVVDYLCLNPVTVPSDDYRMVDISDPGAELYFIHANGAPPWYYPDLDKEGSYTDLVGRASKHGGKLSARVFLGAWMTTECWWKIYEVEHVAEFLERDTFLALPEERETVKQELGRRIEAAMKEVNNAHSNN